MTRDFLAIVVEPTICPDCGMPVDAELDHPAKPFEDLIEHEYYGAWK